MKRIAVLFVALTMAFSLAACSGSQAPSGSDAGSSGSLSVTESSSVPESSSTPEQPESTPEGSGSSSQAADSSGSQPMEAPAEPSQPENTAEPSEGAPEETGGVKVLVAYFSTTNTTEGVAETIAASVGADLYEITPAQPYTSADLNYSDNNSRSTKEMNDPGARPEISGSAADMSRYDIVFLGYPIWWGEAPRIINTFLESYDFSGKTIVPFRTSGSSGIGSSAANLQSSAGGANWLSGRRMSSGVSQSEIAEWVNGLGLELSAE